MVVPDDNTTSGVDVLNADARELQALLTSGKLTSVDLVQVYLNQIERHNLRGMAVRALISVAPQHTVLEIAQQLDEERSRKGSRGPLHGIPVIIKDTFWTAPSLGMDTTCGTLALRGAKPPKNAAIVDLLLQEGMIILGKANLSELALMKGSPPLTGGWSSAGGQCQSPYVRGGVLPNATFLGHSTPCGSSSGSAAGVAAGFAPIGIGHETDGSIVQAATRAGLYGLKPACGTVPLEGTMPVCASFDVHGGIARTAEDVARITSLFTGKDFLKSLSGSWHGIVVGFVDPDLWQPASFVVEPNEAFKQQTYGAMEDAANRINAAGGRVIHNVKLASLAELGEVEGGTDPDNLFGHDFKNSFEKFLASYDESPVRTLQEMIDFNEAHSSECLPPEHPSQDLLKKYLTIKPDPSFESKLAITRGYAQKLITEMLEGNSIDAVLGPADARIASVAAAAGYAIGSVPLGYADFNGRAFGMNIIAGLDGEATIIKIMSAWEKTFPEARKAPPILVNWEMQNL